MGIKASYLKRIVMSIPYIIYFKKYYHSFVIYISHMISTSINIHRNIPLNMYVKWHKICHKFVLKPGQIVHILINNRIIIHYFNLFGGKPKGNTMPRRINKPQKKG